MRKVLLLLAITTASFLSTFSQVAVNTDNSDPNSSAMLDVKSTNKGFLPPRLSTVQRDAISTPAVGLTIYNTDSEVLESYTGPVNGWRSPGSNSSAGLALGTVACDTASVINGGHVKTSLQAQGIVYPLTVEVTTPGMYNIATNTLDRISFSLGGTFPSTGTYNINLIGHGTADTAGLFTFTVSFGNSSCTFRVNVLNNMNVSCDGVPPTITYDGMVYTPVMIGSQCWLKENLNVGTMIYSGNRPTNNNIIEKYCYNDNADLCGIYGGLYSWDEMMNYTSSSSSNPSGVQGICPSGWHIPSNLEYCQLASFLQGATVDCSPPEGWPATIAGGKMKETGTAHWLSPNDGATNESGFKAFGGGYATGASSGFILYEEMGLFQSSTEASAFTSYTATLSYSMTALQVMPFNKSGAYSVRCLKD